MEVLRKDFEKTGRRKI